jgi:hypothetical protein
LKNSPPSVVAPTPNAVPRSPVAAASTNKKGRGRPKATGAAAASPVETKNQYKNQQINKYKIAEVAKDQASWRTWTWSS